MISLILGGTYFNGYVSDIELLWSALAIGGAFFSIHNMRESRKDLAALRERNIRNGRYKIAITALRAESARLAIQLIFLVIGLLAMTFPEPPVVAHEPWKVALFRFFFQWGFIIASALLLLKSYWNYQLRRELIEHGVRLVPHEIESEQER